MVEKYTDYVKQAFGLGYEEEWWTHPFFIAAVTGFVVMALILLVGHKLLKDLPNGLFSRPGSSSTPPSST